MSHRILHAAVVLSIALLCSTQARAATLLADDFNDNSLDGTKWTTDTSVSDIYGTPEVVEQNQRLEIKARGYLNTFGEYDPAGLGGIEITGTWTLIEFNPADLPYVVTRSSGVPTDYFVASGEVTDGINFRIHTGTGGGGDIGIYGSGGATVTGEVLGPNTLNLDPGDTVSFSVIDDGVNLYFNVTEVGDPLSAASATAVSVSTLPTNKISFYNREYDGNRAALDDIVVQSIPEPSLSLLALGGLALLRRSRTRRSRRN